MVQHLRSSCQIQGRLFRESTFPLFSVSQPDLRNSYSSLQHPDLLVVADPRFIHHMLTENPYNYGAFPAPFHNISSIGLIDMIFLVKSPVFRPLVERLLGHGLVWAEGDEHKQQRKVLNPAFR